MKVVEVVGNCLVFITNTSSMRCYVGFQVSQVQNMRMDFNTGGTWRLLGQAMNTIDEKL